MESRMAPNVANQYLLDQPIKYFHNPSPSSENNIRALVNEITGFAHDALAASACSVFLRENDKERSLLQVSGTGYQRKFIGTRALHGFIPRERVPEEPHAGEKLGITSWIVSTGYPFLARNEKEFYSHRHHRGDYDEKLLPKKAKIGTFLGVPIRGLTSSTLGVIKAERIRKPRHPCESFSKEDEIFLSNIAIAAGRCLDYLKTPCGDTFDAVTAWTLDVIATASIAEPDLASFINKVSQVIAAAANAESCSVFVIDENQQYISQIGSCGYQKEGNLIRSYRMPAVDPKTHSVDPKTCDGLTAYIAADGIPQYAPTHDKLTKLPAWQGKYDPVNFKRKNRCEGFFGIPIQVGATTIGVLKIENSSRWRPDAPAPKDDPFPHEVRNQVRLMVQEMAPAIVRLREKEKNQFKVMETAADKINEILQNDTIPELGRAAVEKIGKLLNAGACSLFLREGDELVQSDWGAYGYVKESSGDKKRKYKLIDREAIAENPKRKKQKVGLTVWIASTGRKFVARTNLELRSHPHQTGKFDSKNFRKGERCESFIGVPLMVGEKILGVLKIENKTNQPSARLESFSKEDELTFELMASSVANAIYHLQEAAEENRNAFVMGRRSRSAEPDTMWVLGLKRNKKGLRGFTAKIPPMPEDGILVRTKYLGICGTDIQSFGGETVGPYDLVEFHEALGRVEWVGKKSDHRSVSVGDYVVPIVRRCQEWDKPRSDETELKFDFRVCKEADNCLFYRRPDSCPQGEYPFRTPEGRDVGYRSRGTGKCHGFGSEYFIDTAEWLIPALPVRDLESEPYPEKLLPRLALTEPLAVVWKMKREIERVRPVRNFQDRILTLGMGPIGYLATYLLGSMYPGLESTCVDRVHADKEWIRAIVKRFDVKYRCLPKNKRWDDMLSGGGKRFDIIIEATGNPKEVMKKAINVLAPNGILVLLSVAGRGKRPGMQLSNNDLNAIVKKNARVIGSVNEAREDYENAIAFLRRYHNQQRDDLDPLISRFGMDPGTWSVIRTIRKIKKKHPADRTNGPKIILMETSRDNRDRRKI
jgi:threonine dehydrogenase-like Zn-dependent dehydrogenase/transcriptional regulator with GAF, ATPase, and Fis domain